MRANVDEGDGTENVIEREERMKAYRKVEWPVSAPCMTENHEVYLAGRGYVKVKDLKAGDVFINETNGKTNRVKVSDITLCRQ